MKWCAQVGIGHTKLRSLGQQEEAASVAQNSWSNFTNKCNRRHIGHTKRLLCQQGSRMKRVKQSHFEDVFGMGRRDQRKVYQNAIKVADGDRSRWITCFPVMAGWSDSGVSLTDKHTCGKEDYDTSRHRRRTRMYRQADVRKLRRRGKVIRDILKHCWSKT